MSWARRSRAILLRLGRKRFGAPHARTVAALEAITDLAQLEELNERLLDASSWEELLPAP